MNRAERNALFCEKEYMIPQTIRKHHLLLSACRLSDNDVYQELAIRLLESLDRYKPEKCENLDAYLMLQLKYRLLHMKDCSRLYGIPLAPRRNFFVISLDTPDYYGNPRDWASTDNFQNPAWIEREIELLPTEQKNTLNRLLAGERISCRNKSLLAARIHFRSLLEKR